MDTHPSISFIVAWAVVNLGITARLHCFGRRYFPWRDPSNFEERVNRGTGIFNKTFVVRASRDGLFFGHGIVGFVDSTGGARHRDSGATGGAADPRGA